MLKAALRNVSAVLTLILLTAGTAWAEQSKDIGDYVVHYNALSTQFLSPQVAKAYGVKRSQNRAMLTVSILKKTKEPVGEPSKAEVNSRAVNLTKQVKNLKMREVIDAGAIYYIADFGITNKETLDFTINVKPEGGSQEVITFRQQFFTTQ